MKFAVRWGGHNSPLSTYICTMRYIFVLLAVFFGAISSSAQGSFQLAVLKYRGGGDWYANPTSVPNLVAFCNEELAMDINPEVSYVEIGSPDLFNYPLVHMTGHGNVVFSAQEADNLRRYLIGGGFLHISDNYGMDPYIRPQLKKVFPELELIELPFDHPIYHQAFKFTQGLPKVHEHDNLPPQGLALVYEGRVVVFYDYECDLGDGWEDWEVHKDPEAVRRSALEMGANIVQFVMVGDDL